MPLSSLYSFSPKLYSLSHWLSLQLPCSLNTCPSTPTQTQSPLNSTVYWEKHFWINLLPSLSTQILAWLKRQMCLTAPHWCAVCDTGYFPLQSRSRPLLLCWSFCFVRGGKWAWKWFPLMDVVVPLCHVSCISIAFKYYPNFWNEMGPYSTFS